MRSLYCMCSVFNLQCYSEFIPYQTDNEHATVMLVQPTELHGEVSCYVKFASSYSIGQYSKGLIGSSPIVVKHILSFPGVNRVESEIILT